MTSDHNTMDPKQGIQDEKTSGTRHRRIYTEISKRPMTIPMGDTHGREDSDDQQSSDDEQNERTTLQTRENYETPRSSPTQSTNATNRWSDAMKFNIENIDVDKLATNIIELHKGFPSQADRVWYSIAASVRLSLTKQLKHSSVLLLVTKDQEEKQAAECLAQKVAEVFLTHLGVPPPYKLIDATQLELEDYGLTFIKLKKQLEQHKALIVRNFEKFPAKLSQSLHMLCDRHSPVVVPGVIIFIQQVSMNDTDEIVTRVSDDLTEKWRSAVPEDKLPALLTRVVCNPIKVSKESKLPCRNM